MNFNSKNAVTSKQFDAVIIISAGLNVFQEDQKTMRMRSKRTQIEPNERKRRERSEIEGEERRGERKYTNKKRNGKSAYERWKLFKFVAKMNN